MAPPPVPPAGSLQLRLLNLLTGFNVVVFKLSGGRIGGRLVGARVVLLEHTGRRSGKQRTTPLLGLQDGENVLLVASAGGRNEEPAWSLNLRSNPEAHVQVGRTRHAVRAHVADSEEKAVLWPKVVASYKDYETYQQRTERDIPVVVLEPR